MTLNELQAKLNKQGVTLKAKSGNLTASPKEKLTPDLVEQLKLLKDQFINLLEPKRMEASDPPSHWLNIPDLPVKSAKVKSHDDNLKGIRYKVNLFNKWYIIRFETNIEAISIVDSNSKRRMFADLHEFYRWAWVEHFYADLKFRELN